MSEKKTWFGIIEDGPEILSGGDLKTTDSRVCAISESKTALGIEVDLDGGCACDFSRLPEETNNELFDIIIGDPRLVRNVTVIARGTFEDLELPDDVPTVFGAGDNELEHVYGPKQRLIVFRTQESELLYAFESAVTLLKNVVETIGDDFLKGLE